MSKQFGESDDLQDQTHYSSHLLTQFDGLLAAVRRVDQKYGPYEEFRRWREEAQGYSPGSDTCIACGREFKGES